MNVAPLERLVDAWREEADLFRKRGMERLAEMIESYADELERRLREWEMEALTVPEAAEESGHTADHIRRLIRQGKIQNAGTESSPQVRRCDLAQKWGHEPADGRSPERPADSRSRVARTVVDSD